MWSVESPADAQVSTVLLHLWVFAQSLRTRSSLPQTLPSPREALERLTRTIAHNVRNRGNGNAAQVADRLRRSPRQQRKQQMQRDMRRAQRGNATHLPDVVLQELAASAPEGPYMFLETPAPSSSAATPPPLDSNSLLYLLAEHAILEQIVSSAEALLHLSRVLLGEMQIMRADTTH